MSNRNRDAEGDGTEAEADGDEAERRRSGAVGSEVVPADADLSQVPAPRPGLSPEHVIRTQMSALGENDEPFENAGVVAAYNFAAPSFRERVGGGLEDFRDYLDNPIRRSLIDHRGSLRGELRLDEGEAREKVVVTDSEGEESTYQFLLRKVEDGKYEGCWMTEDIELTYVGASPSHVHMPMVDFDGTQVKCKEGDVLRDILLRASGVSPHNDKAQYANCNGRGICGTCAVEIAEGEVTDRTKQEKRRLSMPPFNDAEDLRLACQSRVLTDLSVKKYEGMWGQHVEEVASETEDEPGGDPIRISGDEYAGEAFGDDGEEGSELESEDEARADDVGGDVGAGTDAGSVAEEYDDDDLELSDEAQSLLDETERILNEDRDED